MQPNRTKFLGLTIDLSSSGVTSRNFTVYFTANYTYNVYINWGDGTAVQTYNGKYSSNSPTHTYASGTNRFDIRIWSESGTLPFVKFSDSSTYMALVSAFYTAFKFTGAGISYYLCSNLTHVDKQCFIYNRWSGQNGTFRNCTKLKLQLEHNFLQHYTSGVLNYMFASAPNLTGVVPTIPNGTTSMLHYCNGASLLSGSLPEIPASVTNMGYAFRNCSDLTGSIPDIPINVTNLYYAFYNCRGLSGKVPYIAGASLPPQGANSAPECNLGSAFRGCTGLRGKAPEFWNPTLYPNVIQPTTSTNACFMGCTGLSNYNDIPPLWK